MKTEQTIQELNKEIVRRYWNGKRNERTESILDELQSSDVIYNGTSETIQGLKEYKLLYNTYLSSFTHTKVEVKELIAEGNLVMSRTEMDATHTGELEGIPPTNKRVHFNAFTIFRIQNGRIAEEWEIFDELNLMMQLGLELQMKEISH